MNDALYSSKRSEWETPKELFDELDRVFNFTLDVCATAQNAKCKLFYSKESAGQDWKGHRCFMNPPYGREISKWVAKADRVSRRGAALVVGLLPARTDTAWWCDFVAPRAEIHFLRGRVKFLLDGKEQAGAPFPSAIAIWYPWQWKKEIT